MENATSKTVQVNGFREMVKILKEHDVSSMPAYCGFGVEVYENEKTETQIVYNCRLNKNEVTINKGF